MAGAYPDGAWRQPIELIEPTRLDHANPRDTTGANILPGFAVGNGVRIQIEITAIRGIIVSLSHKTDWRDTTNPWSAPHSAGRSHAGRSRSREAGAMASVDTIWH